MLLLKNLTPELYNGRQGKLIAYKPVKDIKIISQSQRKAVDLLGLQVASKKSSQKHRDKKKLEVTRMKQEGEEPKKRLGLYLFKLQLLVFLLFTSFLFFHVLDAASHFPVLLSTKHPLTKHLTRTQSRFFLLISCSVALNTFYVVASGSRILTLSAPETSIIIIISVCTPLPLSILAQVVSVLDLVSHPDTI